MPTIEEAKRLLSETKQFLHILKASLEDMTVSSDEMPSPMEERYVLGAVLVPEEEDAQGDIYSAKEVRDAAHCWMEKARGRLAYHHTAQGGIFLDQGEICVLESYLMPADLEIEGEVVKAGTWMLGVRVNSEVIWNQIKAGEITGFSVGGYASTAVEDVPDEPKFA